MNVILKGCLWVVGTGITLTAAAAGGAYLGQRAALREKGLTMDDLVKMGDEMGDLCSNKEEFTGILQQALDTAIKAGTEGDKK